MDMKSGQGHRKPARARYFAEDRRTRHKERRVWASSHGRWTYETLMAHQRGTPGKKKATVSPAERAEHRLLKIHKKALGNLRRACELLRQFALDREPVMRRRLASQRRPAEAA